MKKLLIFLVFLLLQISSPIFAQRSFFVTAYYATWATCGVNPRSIDYSMVTHIIYQSMEPSQANPDPATGLSYSTFPGGLAAFENSPSWCGTYPAMRQLIDSAHAHGVKMILGLGGISNAGNFTWMVQNNHTAEYVHSISNYCKLKGFDGVDVDWERPAWSVGGKAAGSVLLRTLHDTLQTWSPAGIITAATWPDWAGPYGASNDWYADTLNAYVDQINPMWYNFDVQAAQSGFTYHTSPLFDNGCVGAKSSNWNIHNFVKQYVAGGVRKSKIGMGLPGEAGYENNVSPTICGSPAQAMSWRGYVGGIFSYLVDHPERYHWDDLAKSPYLGWSDSAGGHFYTFEDTLSFYYKTKYAIDSGLGGIMYFEYAKGLVFGNPNYLLRGAQKAIKGATNIVIPPSTKFKVGDTVQVFSSAVNVRSNPSVNSGLLGTQAVGSTGRIIGGGMFAEGYFWWNVDFTLAPDGYVVENYLARFVAPIDTIKPCKPDTVRTPCDSTRFYNSGYSAGLIVGDTAGYRRGYNQGLVSCLPKHDTLLINTTSTISKVFRLATITATYDSTVSVTTLRDTVFKK